MIYITVILCPKSCFQVLIDTIGTHMPFYFSFLNMQPSRRLFKTEHFVYAFKEEPSTQTVKGGMDAAALSSGWTTGSGEQQQLCEGR